MNIVIGNAISLIAGIFIILSMWVNDEKRAYKYQFLNAFILIISSVFFYSWTGVVTMAIAASRNAMVYYDRLTFVLPIIAIIQLSLCNYYLKTIKPIKISFIVNSAIYVVYFLAIWDISSAGIESFTALVGLVSLFRLLKSEAAGSN